MVIDSRPSPGSKRARLLLAFLPNWFHALGVALLIVAMGRPQRVNTEQVVSSEGIDIVLAIDVSGSMEALDFRLQGREVDRLHVAKKVVGDFVEARPYDRIGLVVFGEEAFTQVPLTLDHDALSDFLRNVEIGMAGANRTAIGQALAISARQLGRLEAESRVVILLTDGRSNAGSLSPQQAAEAADALGVTVYTIGVGSTESRRRGLFGARTEEIDEATLKEIAQVTGGQYFRATDTKSLTEIYSTIDELEKTTAEVEIRVQREELYRRALAPGVLLLVIGLVLSQTWLRRLSLCLATGWFFTCSGGFLCWGCFSSGRSAGRVGILCHSWARGQRRAGTNTLLEKTGLAVDDDALSDWPASALAQPRWGHEWREQEMRGLEVILALDVSRSMDAEDVDPSRIERARREAQDLIEAMPTSRIGLVLFAGGAYPRMPQTLDHLALRDILNRTGTRRFGRRDPAGNLPMRRRGA